MSLSRAQLDQALDRLQDDVAEWVTHLRDPRLFHPQFDVLAAQVLAQVADADLAHARERIARLLAAHEPPGTEPGWKQPSP
ncbi:MAG: hypothetical protein QM601_03425 [Pseudoxanthomonas sp.]